jgi:hypothetical protein
LKLTLFFALAGAACIAGPTSAVLGATNTHAAVKITAPRTAAAGARISFKVVSTYAVLSNGAEALTVFIAPPRTSCPKAVRPPHGADTLLSREPADRVLIANVISDPLGRAGTWTVCAYLTHGRTTTAHARAKVKVG